MAPRREEAEVIVLGDETPLSSSPNSFSTPSIIKSLSNLSLDHSEDTHALNDNNEVHASKASLITSLQLISERGARLFGRVDETLKIADKDSLIVEACRSSLQSEFLFMFEEAQLLLNNMGAGGNCSITSWRVSLAQIRVDAYLESIETALDCPDASRLNVELLDVAKSIASQLSTKDAELRISPWNLSSLAFDVTVGTPVQHVLKGDFPLNLQVRAIQEIQAMDMIDTDKNVSYQACKLEVERCVHGVGTFRAGAGSVGDVLVTIRVSPIEEENDADIENMQSWESDMTEENRPVVKEARK